MSPPTARARDARAGERRPCASQPPGRRRLLVDRRRAAHSTGDGDDIFGRSASRWTSPQPAAKASRVASTRDVRRDAARSAAAGHDGRRGAGRARADRARRAAWFSSPATRRASRAHAPLGATGCPIISKPFLLDELAATVPRGSRVCSGYLPADDRQLQEHDAMICRSCGNEERASEGYPCVDCGTFICVHVQHARRHAVPDVRGEACAPPPQCRRTARGEERRERAVDFRAVRTRRRACDRRRRRDRAHRDSRHRAVRCAPASPSFGRATGSARAARGVAAITSSIGVSMRSCSPAVRRTDSTPAAGVMRWMEEAVARLRRRRGAWCRSCPAAVVFDLAPLGRFDARPTPRDGATARCEHARRRRDRRVGGRGHRRDGGQGAGPSQCDEGRVRLRRSRRPMRRARRGDRGRERARRRARREREHHRRRARRRMARLPTPCA